jgi:hypothetical protein
MFSEPYKTSDLPSLVTSLDMTNQVYVIFLNYIFLFINSIVFDFIDIVLEFNECLIKVRMIRNLKKV